MWLLDRFLNFLAGCDSKPRSRQFKPEFPRSSPTFNQVLAMEGFELIRDHWRRLDARQCLPNAVERAELIRFAWYWYERGRLLVPILDSAFDRAEDRDMYQRVCADAGMTREEYERLGWYRSAWIHDTVPVRDLALEQAARRIYDHEVETLLRWGAELHFYPFSG